MLRAWLTSGFMDGKTLYSTDAGTPQGGIISPTLANMVLDGLQALLHKRLTPTQEKKHYGLINLVRYADDFIITGRSKELLENEVKPLIETFLAERGLTLSAEKTRVTPIHEGFDFLGFNVRRYGDKLLTKPSNEGIKGLLDKVRGIIEGNRAATQVNLIRVLNPVILGWANYYQHSVAKDIFARVDHDIWAALWRWAKRRHPDKGARWVKDKYFLSLGTRKWVFAASVNGTDGARRLVKLALASDTPIRRHIKIQQDANPYDPVWDDYFAKRSFRKFTERTGQRKEA